MTLEIDIILGNTKNDIKHLGKNTNDEDDDEDKKGGKGKGQPKADAEGSKKKKHQFSLNHDNVDLNTVESNFDKIAILEKTMTNFFKIFMSKKEELDETIQDKHRLRLMEKYERFGLQLFRKDHLI